MRDHYQAGGNRQQYVRNKQTDAHNRCHWTTMPKPWRRIGQERCTKRLYYKKENKEEGDHYAHDYQVAFHA
jgi:hypothetical protein